MEIKELHIRNIASIEAADIDFRDGLNDAVTGMPANVFLISGDTGAGKSAILDAIALALYKNTPRLAGVANQKKNKYASTEGEDININSIEQYTRMGIAADDECYSEVVFVGNDGKTYHAKLELGMRLTNRDANGNRFLHHRAPEWTVMIDNGDYSKVESKTGQPIRDAIGLDFEQFNRMAMLAQGQFAEFLTGGKEKREVILERLTNTQLFSDYGEAIHSLFSKAKKDKETAETTRDNEKAHTIDDTQLKALNEQKAASEQQQKELGEGKKKVDATLTIVNAIEEKERERGEWEQKKALVEATINGEDYKQKKALCRDWDATDNERKAVADLCNAKRGKQEAEQGLGTTRESFIKLVADIAYRKVEKDKKEQEKKNIDSYLGKRKDHDLLFTNAAAVEEQLKQYQKVKKDLEKKQEELTKEQEKTQKLNDDAAEKQKRVELANKAVADKQEEIDAKTEERNKLSPDQVNESINKLNRRNETVKKLRDRLDALTEAKKNAEKSHDDIEKGKATLGEKKSVWEETEKVFKGKDVQYTAARNRLATMKMSTNEMLIELRQRLANEHTETCPLCGQHIDTLWFNQDFDQVLTPLQQEEESAEKELKEARAQRDKAKSDYDTLNGSLKKMEADLDAAAKKIKADETALNKAATTAGFDTEQGLGKQIDQELETNKKDLDQLVEKQKKVGAIQSEIDKLLNEKRPLDDALSNAKEAKNKADKAIESNATAIKNSNDTIDKLSKDKGTLEETLATQLDTTYHSWREEPDTVRETLATDAKNYNDKKRELERIANDIQRDQDVLNSVENTRQEILSIFPDWEAPTDPLQHQCNNIATEWATLFGSLKEWQNQLGQNNKSIDEANRILKPYYIKTGKDEAHLVALAKKGDDVAAARNFVNDKNSKLKSCQDAIVQAIEKNKENMAKLGVEEMAALPIKSDLETQQKEMEETIKKLEGDIGGIKEQLKNDAANKQRLAVAESKLANAELVYEKWKKFDDVFGGTKFRTLVQSYILRPLLNNANIYLSKITDRYTLTCSDDNEQLSILILDKYNKDEVRSVTVLSGGERFMVSLALSLALSSLNRTDMNVNILFIDEGFGTLDEKSLDSVMATLEKLQEIAGQSNRRVGIISHREELNDRIPVQIQVIKKGEGRSQIKVVGTT